MYEQEEMLLLNAQAMRQLNALRDNYRNVYTPRGRKRRNCRVPSCGAIVENMIAEAYFRLDLDKLVKENVR
jgi:hypothetical protein